MFWMDCLQQTPPCQARAIVAPHILSQSRSTTHQQKSGPPSHRPTCFLGKSSRHPYPRPIIHAHRETSLRISQQVWIHSYHNGDVRWCLFLVVRATKLYIPHLSMAHILQRGEYIHHSSGPEPKPKSREHRHPATSSKDEVFNMTIASQPDQPHKSVEISLAGS